MTISPATAARFWANVEIRPPHMCWTWIRPMHNTGGYGRFSYGNARHLAHRFCMRLMGRDPGPLLVRHTCDNRMCVNPRHLALGTHQDNSRDMVDRGRSCKGSRHPAAKLTEELVLDLRRRRAKGARVKDLAAVAGISRTMMSRLLHGWAWTHVPMPGPDWGGHPDGGSAPPDP